MKPIKFKRRQWIVLTVLACGYFLALLDLTVINLAIPHFTADLDATIDESFWAINAYVVSFASMLLSAGKLGDAYGRKRVFLVGVIGLVLSSLLCGLADSIELLIFFRVLQGISAGLLLPQTLSIIVTMFPEETRGRALGFWGSLGGLASIAGPLAGGVIVDMASWRWIFFINVPIGLIVFVTAAFLVPPSKARSIRVNWGGSFLGGLGLLAILFGLLQGPRYSWSMVPVSALMAGVALIILFLHWENRKDPELAIVPSSLVNIKSFVQACVAGLAVGVAVFAVTLTISLYGQSVQGESATFAGALLVPASLAAVILAPIAGRVVDGGKLYPVLTFGSVISIFSVVMAATTMVLELPLWIIGIAMLLFGVGNACLITPLMAAGLSGVSQELIGAATSLLTTLRQVGAALGGALVGLTIQVASVSAIEAGQLEGKLTAAGSVLSLTVPLVALALVLFLYGAKVVRSGFKRSRATKLLRISPPKF